MKKSNAYDRIGVVSFIFNSKEDIQFMICIDIKLFFDDNTLKMN